MYHHPRHSRVPVSYRRELPPSPGLNPRNPMAARPEGEVLLERIERRAREIQNRRPQQGKVSTEELLLGAHRLLTREPTLAEAVDLLSQVDFAAFPGLYDQIPWKALEAAAGGK